MEYLGPNNKQSKKHGDKWYKVIEQSNATNDNCSELDDDENELTDDDDDSNNNNINNQTRYVVSSSENVNYVRDFFDCLRFRRNYKRNRKKSDEGQSLLFLPSS